jgi:ADP-ribose pyrophosphatase YjhB (NUDIX family)
MKLFRSPIAIAFIALLSACQETLEERCAREAITYTKKNCPLQIDAYTVMDSMMFDASSHTIVYAYTLNGQLDDTTFINKQMPKERLLKEVKNSTHLKLYKEAGYNFRYSYFSAKKKGTKLFEATFRENDYR